MNVHWKDWCWSWSSNTLSTWCKEPAHWKRPWCWERLRAGGEGETEEEMVGWHHRLSGHEFEQTLGDSKGQVNQVCCSPWGHKESDMTEWHAYCCIDWFLKFRNILWIFSHVNGKYKYSYEYLLLMEFSSLGLHHDYLKFEQVKGDGTQHRGVTLGRGRHIPPILMGRKGIGR